MTINLDRALKRATKLLRIIKEIRSNNEESVLNSKNIEWIRSNRDILQEEMENYGYGKGYYSGSWFFEKYYSVNENFKFIKNFPMVINFSRREKTDDVIRVSNKIHDHLLRFIQKIKEIKEDEVSLNQELKKEIKNLKPDLILTHYGYFLNNDKEVNIFLSNLKSLKKFEIDSNYKYCMIAMGSILEFLLKRYCKRKGIEPESYNNILGKTFSNYIEAAIKKEIFGDKKYWELVQNHLRDFRNYIHIQKEVKSSKIDFNWYKIIKPAFDYLLKNFQKESAKELS